MGNSNDMGQWRLIDMFVGGFWPPWTVIGVMFANLADSGARPWAGFTMESLEGLLRFDRSRPAVFETAWNVCVYRSGSGYRFRQKPWVFSQLWSHMNSMFILVLDVYIELNWSSDLTQLPIDHQGFGLDQNQLLLWQRQSHLGLCPSPMDLMTSLAKDPLRD